MTSTLCAVDTVSAIAADVYLFAFMVVGTLVWSRVCPYCWRFISSLLSHCRDAQHVGIAADIPKEEVCCASDFHKPSEHLQDIPEAASRCEMFEKAAPEGIQIAAKAIPDSFDTLCTWSDEIENLPVMSSKETMDLWQEPSDSLYLFETGDALLDQCSSNEAVLDCEEASTKDACSVLEAAIASGDAQLADSALAAGLRTCDGTWLAQACEGLLAAGIELDSQRLVGVMHVFSNEHRADLAVDLWQAVSSSLCDNSDAAHARRAADLYGAALEVCARCGDFETAASAANRAGWRSPPCKFGQTALLALARWLARRQDVNRALDCYEAVRRASGCADLATHRAVLIASVRSADMAQAEELFQDLEASGLVPDGPCLSTMICGHCGAGNVDKALDYFARLKGNGIAPTAPVFDALLDSCAWMNLPSLMEQVLADMEAADVRPSTSTLTILLRNYGSNGETERALAVFEELPKRHGFELDGPAYGALISVCLSNGCFNVAWSAFERMSESGRVPHARTYEALITSCLRHGYLQRSVRVVEEALSPRAQHQDEVPQAAPRVRLERKVIEDVLRLCGRRHEVSTIGAPLLARLQAAGVEVAESLVDAIHRSCRLELEPGPAELSAFVLQQRHLQLQRWRNFSS